MSEHRDIKIFISSHKPTDYIKNQTFQPIQVGTALPGHQKIAGFLYDDEGDNISEKNPRFCELTAQYWAWKHVDAEYYGFFHYRRYLSFNSHPQRATDIWGSIIEPGIDDEVIMTYQLTDQAIQQLMSEYDIILPEAKDITTMPGMGRNLREQYVGSGFLHERDLDIMLEVLREKYPDYMPYAERYLAGRRTYLNNMFIMRKDIFEQYCEWLFDIVFECDRRIDYDDYSVEALRTPGHLAERLLNIYIMYLRDHTNYRIKELPTVVFLDTDPLPDLHPAFAKNNVAIAMSANDFYSPYVATVLTSIRANSTPSHNYDIMIMHQDITEHNRRRLRQIFQQHDNFSLRFVNIARYEKRFKSLFLRGHFTIETWFRLLMPEIMPHFDKVLYLDADLVTNADVAELYQTDIQDYLLAACHDADTAGLYNGFEPSKKSYMDNILKIKHPYDYFQAGVILFNLAKFREQFTVDEMLQYAASYPWQLLDQDVLNHLAEGQVKFVDMAWNVMYDWRYLRAKEIIGRAPKALRDEYFVAHAHPKIIHYAGPDKPWQDPQVDYAEDFWRYARDSGYYEVAIYNMLHNAHSSGIIKRGVKSVIRRTLPAGTKRRKTIESAYRKIRK